MGILQNDLPVTLCSEVDNPEGEKFQGRLRAINREAIQIFTPDSARFSGGMPVRVEFRIDPNQFHFETSIIANGAGGLVLLKKPEIIKKSKLREGPRVELDLSIKFTPWAEEGLFEATIQDVSESGVRMLGRKQLRSGDLISLDFYLKEPRIRVMTQGLVAWCRPLPENELLFESGVQFTTISNETRKKLARHLLEVIGEETAE